MPGIGLNILDDCAGIGRYLLRNPKTCFAAEEDGTIIGAILSGHDGHRPHANRHLNARTQNKRTSGFSHPTIAEGEPKILFLFAIQDCTL